MRNNFRIDIFSWLSLFFGLASFLIFSDIAILNPTNISWLMRGDPAQHYLGWSTFRHTPLLQWPVGLNYNYGMAISSSIVFTDSIPLVAIPLKYLSSILPVEFQYSGIWLLICYVLQSLFGYKIFNHLTKDKAFSIVGGFILSFAPTLLLRMQGHYALCAQFLVLASFLLYLKPFSFRKWAVLICITASVHAYLLMMVLAVFFVKVVIELFESRDYKRYITSFFVTLLLCFILMYAEGYFVISNGLAAGGFGEFRSDLLTFFNPFSPAFSRFLRVNNNQLENGEGLGYLGFGVIICLSALLIMFSKKIECSGKKILSLTYILPAVGLLGLYIFAVSNVVSLQGFETFRFKLPEFLVGPFNTFRASGRFIWPVSYFLMIASIVSIWFLAKKHCLPLIILVALVQLFDIYKFGDLARATIETTSEKWIKNDINEYNVDYSRFNSVAMIPPRDFTDKSNVIYLSALHGLPVNAGYMARYDVIKDAAQNKEIDELIKNKILDKDTIYFIGDSARDLSSLCGKGYICQDGFAGLMMYKSE
ncbi:hypothetical protein JK231_08090 [Pantoea sp. JGM49]|uniref:DUF6311 domain-containing protein n=1 Tax=Pantoea sp. JGM49 TaxID=2799791 RepID=UPI001BAC6093|nr:DUF6311 domain-containing protein [Pantoea sp. JGM49]MBS0880558.1 hypothetical protein [Pantoea sp. JGM49]